MIRSSRPPPSKTFNNFARPLDLAVIYAEQYWLHVCGHNAEIPRVFIFLDLCVTWYFYSFPPPYYSHGVKYTMPDRIKY